MLVCHLLLPLACESHEGRSNVCVIFGSTLWLNATWEGEGERERERKGKEGKGRGRGGGKKREVERKGRHVSTGAMLVPASVNRRKTFTVSSDFTFIDFKSLCNYYLIKSHNPKGSFSIKLK